MLYQRWIICLGKSGWEIIYESLETLHMSGTIYPLFEQCDHSIDMCKSELLYWFTYGYQSTKIDIMFQIIECHSLSFTHLPFPKCEQSSLRTIHPPMDRPPGRPPTTTRPWPTRRLTYTCISYLPILQCVAAGLKQTIHTWVQFNRYDLTTWGIVKKRQCILVLPTIYNYSCNYYYYYFWI